jgi:hypothetical protein
VHVLDDENVSQNSVEQVQKVLHYSSFSVVPDLRVQVLVLQYFYYIVVHVDMDS